MCQAFTLLHLIYTHFYFRIIIPAHLGMYFRAEVMSNEKLFK